MNFEIKKSFNKDINKIRDEKLLNAILEIIEQIQRAASVKDIKHVKKMEGSKNHYRIKLGDYRLGLFIDKKTVYIVRFLHRKEIYRYFP